MTTQELAQHKKAEVTRREPAMAEYFRPVTDIWETSDEVMIRFDMPGVPSENVDLTVEKGTLTVTGIARPEEDGTPVYRESRIGNYRREFSLSEDIDPDHITAEMKTGVLTVRIPKPEKIKPKRISIATA
ncbi:Hsp20/alpha crystallin family protein [Planctomycetota bacterium]